jgi:hypothetical protein
MGVFSASANLEQVSRVDVVKGVFVDKVFGPVAQNALDRRALKQGFWVGVSHSQPTIAKPKPATSQLASKNRLVGRSQKTCPWLGEDAVPGESYSRLE